jgi:hypothetical protein
MRKVVPLVSIILVHLFVAVVLLTVLKRLFTVAILLLAVVVKLAIVVVLKLLWALANVIFSTEVVKQGIFFLKIPVEPIFCYSLFLKNGKLRHFLNFR